MLFELVTNFGYVNYSLLVDLFTLYSMVANAKLPLYTMNFIYRATCPCYLFALAFTLLAIHNNRSPLYVHKISLYVIFKFHIYFLENSPHLYALCLLLLLQIHISLACNSMGCTVPYNIPYHT